MAISLKTATMAQLKEIAHVGDNRAEILLELRRSRQQLTFVLIESITGRPMAPEEKAMFIEWIKGDDSDSDDDSKGGKPSGRPRGLRFDGSSSWRVFRRKFEMFQQRSQWDDKAALDYLGWALEGPPAEFFVIVSDTQGAQTCQSMLEKLEKRYGVLDDEEVMVGKLNAARQRQGESLEAWLERVQTMAMQAFAGCPERFITRESLRIFCGNCWDQAAGKFAALSGPQSLQDALERIKKYKFVHRETESREMPASVQHIEVGKELVEKLIEKIEVLGSYKPNVEINRVMQADTKDTAWAKVMEKIEEMSKDIAALKSSGG